LAHFQVYYGGIGDDAYTEPQCTTDPSDNVYLASTTTSSAGAITTLGSHQSTFGGGVFDSFLVKFIECTSPTITVNSGSICIGQSYTIVPSGASTYTYSSSSAIVSPTANTTYSVIGKDSIGCFASNTAISTVTVNANPTVLALASNSLICVGNNAVLSASSTATSYTWNTGATTMSVSVSPTITTTYSVNAANINGCIGNGTITVNVSTCTGINETHSNSISIYPNPNKGEFIIELNETTQVIITNVLGSVLLQSTLNAGKQTLDIKNNANGIYFVKLILGDKQQTIKLIKE
jgi:hypothetical protein